MQRRFDRVRSRRKCLLLPALSRLWRGRLVCPACVTFWLHLLRFRGHRRAALAASRYRRAADVLALDLVLSLFFLLIVLGMFLLVLFCFYLHAYIFYTAVIVVGNFFINVFCL